MKTIHKSVVTPRTYGELLTQGLTWCGQAARWGVTFNVAHFETRVDMMRAFMEYVAHRSQACEHAMA